MSVTTTKEQRATALKLSGLRFSEDHITPGFATRLEAWLERGEEPEVIHPLGNAIEIASALAAQWHAGQDRLCLLLAELHEHLGLMVSALEREAAAGDGIAEDDYDAYVAAKSLLVRAEPGKEVETAVFAIAERETLAEQRGYQAGRVDGILEAYDYNGDGVMRDRLLGGAE